MNKLDQILAEAQRRRETSYREKALKMYPHICGRCGREFSGKRGAGCPGLTCNGGLLRGVAGRVRICGCA